MERSMEHEDKKYNLNEVLPEKKDENQRPEEDLKKESEAQSIND